MPILRSGYATRSPNGTTSERGYGTDHQRRRADLLPHAYGTPCPLCHHLMLLGQDLDLDHTTSLLSDPMSRGDRIVHRTCNRRRGGV